MMTDDHNASTSEETAVEVVRAAAEAMYAAQRPLSELSRIERGAYYETGVRAGKFLQEEFDPLHEVFQDLVDRHGVSITRQIDGVKVEAQKPVDEAALAEISAAAIQCVELTLGGFNIPGPIAKDHEARYDKRMEFYYLADEAGLAEAIKEKVEPRIYETFTNLAQMEREKRGEASDPMGETDLPRPPMA